MHFRHMIHGHHLKLMLCWGLLPRGLLSRSRNLRSLYGTCVICFLYMFHFPFFLFLNRRFFKVFLVLDNSHILKKIFDSPLMLDCSLSLIFNYDFMNFGHIWWWRWTFLSRHQNLRCLIIEAQVLKSGEPTWFWEHWCPELTTFRCVVRVSYHFILYLFYCSHRK